MIENNEMNEGIYHQLRMLAARQFRDQPPTSTLQPTALVHEAYLRLLRCDPALFANHEHFLAVAATAMRQILVDRSRRRRAAKRGGEWARITLDSAQPFLGEDDATVDILTLDNTLNQLAVLNPRQARVVELRVFAGLTVPEVAEVLSVSTATVEKDWRQARAWLRVQLTEPSDA